MSVSENKPNVAPHVAPQFHTTTQFAGRTLVIGQTVLTGTQKGVSYAVCAYIGQNEHGQEEPLFAVHFTAYPVPLLFVDDVAKLGEGRWTFTPKPK